MSDYVVKIITENPSDNISAEVLNTVVQFIKNEIRADSIMAHSSKNTTFIDCGENLEYIKCPLCEHKLTFDWWTKAMTTASKNNFENLAVNLPCCNKESSLNDLNYFFPCGFSKMEIDILNPANPISKEQLYQIESIFQKSIRVIDAHI